MSLDGFTAGPGVSAGHPMGEGGTRLHEWLFADPMDPADAEVASAMYAPAKVGAVLMGRRHFDVGIAQWGDDGTFGMPCFVVTRQLLHAGLIDEIEINLVPIVLGGGASLFGGLKSEEITLEQIAVRPTSTVTHLRYRIVMSR